MKTLRSKFKITIENSKLYITFQGSNGKFDWMSDLNFFKKKVKPYGNEDTDIEIHGGFYEQYQIVRQFIHEQLEGLYKDFNEIIVNGHSLGSAIAVLCAIDIQYNYPNRLISIYGFGSPRVGNRAFTKSYKKRISEIYEFRYNEDVVTKVPYEWMGFRHVNLLELTKNPDQGADVWGWLTINKFPIPCALLGGNWKDHYPERYKKAIMLKNI